MRNIEASVENYLEMVRDQGASIISAASTLDIYYEAARFIKQYDGSSIVKYMVKGFHWPFISNLIANRETLYRALGAKDDREAYTVLSKASSSPRQKFEERAFSRYFEHVGEELSLLPALRFYDRDGGRYITSSVFIACSEGVCNASIHRIMVSDSDSYAAVRVVPRHLYRMLKKSGEKGLPVAVVIGVDPRVLLAAATSPPYGVFELGIAASMLGGLAICRTPRYNLPVPCGSSMVVEARLGPDRAREGPFVDLLQLYDDVRQEPVLHVEYIYVNKVYKPYMHVILPGGYEHMMLMGFPREAAIYEAVSRAVAGVSKVRLTPAGGMWLHAVVSIEKQHDGDGKSAGLAALAAHPSLKHVVVVDSDIDPDDSRQVEWAIATRLQADRGLVVIPAARGSTLDPSAQEGLTYKLLVDATMPIRDRGKYVRPTIGGQG
ncbi:MAG TPA: UbiD family decarboxylase [Pyrodictium delaneyi]|uniref:Anhydromevalonate phosphate decarboxylase n=1 Tax=Pyrodictium delaneyi TaxID=1273541 RepID=A0A832ZTG0_9CREN|nr:UbiD family decarboxylase [Pyrodictium delaneyi]